MKGIGYNRSASDEIIHVKKRLERMLAILTPTVLWKVFILLPGRFEGGLAEKMVSDEAHQISTTREAPLR
jgi:hypothetical protein